MDGTTDRDQFWGRIPSVLSSETYCRYVFSNPPLKCLFTPQARVGDSCFRIGNGREEYYGSSEHKHDEPCRMLYRSTRPPNRIRHHFRNELLMFSKKGTARSSTQPCADIAGVDDGFFLQRPVTELGCGTSVSSHHIRVLLMEPALSLQPRKPS